jgi:hypothetical protein
MFSKPDRLADVPESFSSMKLSICLEETWLPWLPTNDSIAKITVARSLAFE